MNQPNPPSNHPWPPLPYGNVPQPVPPDPGIYARQASMYMWILGAIAVLFGILCGVVSAAMTPENIAQVPQGGQILELERQVGVSIKTVYLVFAMICIGVGGLIGVLAFPVRNLSYGGTIASIIFIGLIGLMLLLIVFIGLIGGAMTGPQGLIGPCFMLVPTVLAGFALTALVRSIRLQSAIQMAARYGAMYGQPPAAQQGWQQPAAQPWHQQAPPSQLPPSPQLPRQPTPPPGGLFGPAPFGIPPPPDATEGKYGYPTKPKEKPGEGDPPTGPHADRSE